MRSRLSTVGIALAIAATGVGAIAVTHRHPPSTPRLSGTRASQSIVAAETIYDGALGPSWNDWGWAATGFGRGAIQLRAQNYGGWIVEHSALSGRFGALTFRLRAPKDFGDFLEVRVESSQKSVYPRVVVGPEHRRDLDGDWSEVSISLRALDPEGLAFDRIAFRAMKPLGPGVVELDKIVLTKADPGDVVASTTPTRLVRLAIDCRAIGIAINPMIYGIAYDPRLDAKTAHQWQLGASARRWGGNGASRYNWGLGNAWNTASDWYFENVNYTGDATYSWTRFLDDEALQHVRTALTVPTIGWVAKDVSSVSYPISIVGPQRSKDGYRPEAGDGMSVAGRPLEAPPPTRTSVASTPASVGAWVQAIRARDAASGQRSVDVYILDNEPMLWNSTHRDVHPDPVGYDELLEKTIAYGEAIRAADPGATIAGPALWGWPAYSFSAKDAAAGFRLKPDRLAHGDVALLPWWLREVRAHERATGHRLIDLVDVHLYPQADRVGGVDGGIDAATSALRVRSTRALWDPTYVDESWIAEAVQLVPRLKQWIADNAPGVGIQIGEWNFGAETHVSGGLAVAEMLGHMGEIGVTSAFYWTYPPNDSPAFWAFRAFRGFDGAGGRFLDSTLPTAHAIADDGTAAFASRDAAGTHVVIVVLNLAHDARAKPRLALGGVATITSARLFRYGGEPGGFKPGVVTIEPAASEGAVVTSEPLAPSSINVFDLQLEKSP
ncbi:MAG: glycoside hydrolase family 44 protein [Polyangiales bacterium]